MVEFLTGNHVGKIAGRCHHVFWPKFRPVGLPVFPPPSVHHPSVCTFRFWRSTAQLYVPQHAMQPWIVDTGSHFFGQKVWVAVYDFFNKLEWNTPSCATMESTIRLWICSLSHTGSTHASLLLHNIGASLASAPIRHSTKNMLNGHIQNHISTKIMDWWLTGHQSQATFNPKTIKVWAFKAFRSLQLFICDFLSILLRTAT